MFRFIVVIAVTTTLALLTAAPLEAQCNKCITQWEGGIAEHWFGNTPEDTKYEGDHSNVEGGTCGHYHTCCSGCDGIMGALSKIEAGQFDFESLRALKEAMGGRLVLDYSTGTAYAMTCAWKVEAKFEVPVRWMVALTTAPRGSFINY